MILSFVLGNVVALVLDELHQGFLDDVGKRTIILPGQVFQMLAEPFFTFLREIDVQVWHKLIRYKLIESGISCYNRM
jgi:hypothetical protein